MIYPANFEEKIGFDRIREQVTALCSTPSAKAKLAEEGFSTSADEIERRLSLMNEMRSLLMLERDFPTATIPILRRWWLKSGSKGVICSLPKRISCARRSLPSGRSRSSSWGGAGHAIRAFGS